MQDTRYTRETTIIELDLFQINGALEYMGNVIEYPVSNFYSWRLDSRRYVPWSKNCEYLMDEIEDKVETL